MDAMNFAENVDACATQRFNEHDDYIVVDSNPSDEPVPSLILPPPISTAAQDEETNGTITADKQGSLANGTDEPMTSLRRRLAAIDLYESSGADADDEYDALYSSCDETYASSRNDDMTSSFCNDIDSSCLNIKTRVGEQSFFEDTTIRVNLGSNGAEHGHETQQSADQSSLSSPDEFMGDDVGTNEQVNSHRATGPRREAWWADFTDAIRTGTSWIANSGRMTDSLIRQVYHATIEDGNEAEDEDESWDETDEDRRFDWTEEMQLDVHDTAVTQVASNVTEQTSEDDIVEAVNQELLQSDAFNAATSSSRRRAVVDLADLTLLDYCVPIAPPSLMPETIVIVAGHDEDSDEDEDEGPTMFSEMHGVADRLYKRFFPAEVADLGESSQTE